jgi:hypothetical protein
MDRRFQDFTHVALTRSVDTEGVHMPEGARGVVMAAYADGLAYEVEFDEPRQVVLTIEGKDLRRERMAA